MHGNGICAIYTETIQMYHNSPSMCDNQNGGSGHSTPRWSNRDQIPHVNSFVQIDHFRFEGSQLEDRTVDKMWLVRHLELIRQNVVQDLRTVKVRETTTTTTGYSIQIYKAMRGSG